MMFWRNFYAYLDDVKKKGNLTTLLFKNKKQQDFLPKFLLYEVINLFLSFASYNLNKFYTKSISTAK